MQVVDAEIEGCCAVNEKEYTIEEIYGLFLRELKFIAINYFCKNNIIFNNKCVITIPAYFNETQRQATLDASFIAGLECIRIINEPTSAALAYGIIKNETKEDKHIIVVDFGAGTLDVSCVNVCDDVFTVLAAAGNNNLGGENFTFKLMDYISQELQLFDINQTREIAEKCKIHLSTELSYTIYHTEIINYISDKRYVLNGITYIFNEKMYTFQNKKELIITREKFESLCFDLFQEIVYPIYDVIECAKIKEENLEFLLVGGATLMPYVKFLIQNTFCKVEQDQLLLNETKQKITISDYINPFYVVSIGAAIQGYMLVSKNDPFFEDILLLDVIALSLGLETADGLFNRIIDRNTMIPIEKTKKFITSEDGMNEIILDIYQGEKLMAKDNFHIGNLKLSNIQNKNDNRTKIIVKFKVDHNSIISIEVNEFMNQDNEAKLQIDLKKHKLSKQKLQEIIESHEKEALINEIKQNLIKEYYFFYSSLQNIHYNLELNEILKNEHEKEIIEMESKVQEITKDFLKDKWNLIIDKDSIDCEIVFNSLKSICDIIRDKYQLLILEIKLENDLGANKMENFDII